ncbi:MAG: transcription termination factor Rho [Coriobacteriales bacterium]|jgi:transcription termination factor Rho|nr:transcription termination factor Rho [Coriobacteriales bacterium]
MSETILVDATTASPASAAELAAEKKHGIRKPRRATAVRKAVETVETVRVGQDAAAVGAGTDADADAPVATPAASAPTAKKTTRSRTVKSAPATPEAAAFVPPAAAATSAKTPTAAAASAPATSPPFASSPFYAPAERPEAERPRRGRPPRQQENDGYRNNDSARSDYGRGRNNGKQNSQQAQRQQQRQRRPYPSQREIIPQTTREDLEVLKIGELRAKAAELELDISHIRKKEQIIDIVLAGMVRAEGFIECAGVLDLLPEGYGFLRASGYLPGEKDVYVGVSVVRRNGLRKGDLITGQVRPARENERFAAIQRIDSVNGGPLEDIAGRPRFADLTPVYPDQRLLMEHNKDAITARTIDLVAPIGKGQRGLIVSPPKAGKTTILKDIAAAISANNPDVHLMCLLVDERPEEVTDMQRSIRGEVISSTFDMPSENHIAVAELVIERAKRLVESGRDVVILLDSITRLARAYNLAQPASGRILSGGVDSTALYPPKRFLGAARNIEGGGSLTILASALIETGSKMDEVIFEEFKGTGNMELRLDRDLADRRIFPAIDPVASGTRKEELLLDSQEAPLIWAVRRILANLNNTERAMEMLIKSLKQTQNNAEFLIRTAKRAQNNQRSSDGIEL